jgi:methyl-accepting chemotaxis protein
MFVDPLEAKSEAYKKFWAELKLGKASTAEFRRLSKSGKEIWIQAFYTPIFKNGKVDSVIKFATDITSEVDKREKFEMLSMVADETDNSVVITGANGFIEYVNSGFERLTGFRFEDVKGKKPGHILQGQHTESTTVDRIRQHLSNTEPFYDEILNYTQEGDPYWISLSINPVFDNNGKLKQFVSEQANISDVKQMALTFNRKFDAINYTLLIMDIDPHYKSVHCNKLIENKLHGKFQPDAFRHMIMSGLSNAELQELSDSATLSKVVSVDLLNIIIDCRLCCLPVSNWRKRFTIFALSLLVFLRGKPNIKGKYVRFL